LFDCLAELFNLDCSCNLLFKKTKEILDVFREEYFCLLILDGNWQRRICSNQPLHLLIVYCLDFQKVDNGETPAVANQFREDFRVEIAGLDVSL